MAAFGFTVLLSAFLLFQVQLFLGKFILPWFGGVPAVWTTCMLVFQVLLLAGYAYAHGTVSRFTHRTQRRLHGVLVALAVAWLYIQAAVWGAPVLPDASWMPEGGNNPIGAIVLLLVGSVGLPFFVLAATGPLIQAWLTATHPGLSPYRLYALSNLGSLLGLITYPFAVEVWLPLRLQALAWGAGFLAFALGITASARVPVREAKRAAHRPARRSAPAEGDAPGWRSFALWFAFSGCASVLLLATTNEVSQEIAVVPFLWMLPLCLYLLSFILCFDSSRWYSRTVYGTLLAVGLALGTFVMERGVNAHILVQIFFPALTLFAACMVCHGELAARKPPGRYLTAFFLTVTVGGAFGGLFVGIAAPLLFPGLWEYPIALWTAGALLLGVWLASPALWPRGPRAWPAYGACAAALLTAAYIFRETVLEDPPEISDAWLFGALPALAVAGLAARRYWPPAGRARPRAGRRPRPAPFWRMPPALASLAALLLLGACYGYLMYTPLAGSLARFRNFFGILRVVEASGDLPGESVLELRHGRIVHGVQNLAPERRLEPTAYYGPGAGIGLAIQHHPRRPTGLRLGVLGLGTGTLAAFGEKRDVIRFYEINPDVIRISGLDKPIFTFAAAGRAKSEFVLGDGRLMLERELAREGSRRFDILALDAFSSDSIPMHLLTREAMRTYLGHLAPGGILAIHISNRYLDLAPVVRGIAREFGLAHVLISAEQEDDHWATTWALLAREPAVLKAPAIANAADPEEAGGDAFVWSDDYSNLLRVLKL